MRPHYRTSPQSCAIPVHQQDCAGPCEEVAAVPREHRLREWREHAAVAPGLHQQPSTCHELSESGGLHPLINSLICNDAKSLITNNKFLNLLHCMMIRCL